jgi:hypothetical protein
MSDTICTVYMIYDILRMLPTAYSMRRADGEKIRRKNKDFYLFLIIIIYYHLIIYIIYYYWYWCCKMLNVILSDPALQYYTFFVF